MRSEAGSPELGRVRPEPDAGAPVAVPVRCQPTTGPAAAPFAAPSARWRRWPALRRKGRITFPARWNRRRAGPFR